MSFLGNSQSALLRGENRLEHPELYQFTPPKLGGKSQETTKAKKKRRNLAEGWVLDLEFASILRYHSSTFWESSHMQQKYLVPLPCRSSPQIWGFQANFDAEGHTSG